jgi:hypothetical protein
VVKPFSGPISAFLIDFSRFPLYNVPLEPVA